MINNIKLTHCYIKHFIQKRIINLVILFEIIMNLIISLTSSNLYLWVYEMWARMFYSSCVVVISRRGRYSIIVNTRRWIFSATKETLFCYKYFVHRANIGMCCGKYSEISSSTIQHSANCSNIEEQLRYCKIWNMNVPTLLNSFITSKNIFLSIQHFLPSLNTERYILIFS